MRVPRLFFLLALLTTVTFASACSNPLSDLFGSKDKSEDTTTDTFNGALVPNGSLVFTFSVTKAGSVDVTLKAVTPATTGPLGLGIGPASTGSCTISSSTSGVTAGGGPHLSATENPGNYCVQVIDAGSLATMSTVTVTVKHR